MNLRYYIIRSVGFAALSFLCAAPVYSQITKRIPDQDQTATAVAQDGATVWVGTPVGAYRIDGDTAKRVPDFKIDVQAISVIDGVVWLATTQGAYRVDGNRAVRVPDQGLVVTSIHEVGGRVWLATTKGAYLVDGDTAQRTPDTDLDVADIVSIDGNPWLATDRGAFQLTPHGSTYTARHVVNLDYGLNQIVNLDGKAWLATDQGAFRIDPSGPKHIELITPADPSRRFTGKLKEVFHIVPAGGGIWFIGRSGPFRVSGDVAYRIPDADNEVATIVEGPKTAGQSTAPVWIATRTGAYRVIGNDVRRIPDMPLDVAGITLVNGHIWLATAQGAFVVDGDTARRVPDQPLSVSSVSDANGNALLSTSTGAILVDKGGQAHSVLGGGVAVLGTHIAGGNVWLSTSDGSFRVDTNDILRLRLVPKPAAWDWERALLPKGWMPAGDYGVRVVGFDADTGTAHSVDAAQVALGSSDAFVDPATIHLRLTPGARIVEGRIKAGWTPPISVAIGVRVVPVWGVPAVFVLVGWLIFGAAVFAFGPYSMGCWRLLMIPSFRGLGSLGLVSLLLLVPAGRSYLLLRYRRGLRDALGPSPAGEERVALEAAGRRMAASRVSHVDAIPTSESFVTACQIARRALDRDADLGPARRFVPAPILISGDEVRDIASLVPQLAADYGGLTDRALTRQLLDRGGWLLIVEADTPSTLDGRESKAFVEEFIQRYRTRNYVLAVRRPD